MVFIQPVVIVEGSECENRTRREGTEQCNQKGQIQMPNMECLIEQIAEIINEPGDGEVLFSSFSMTYAYGQTTLHPDTAKHCNFQIVGEKQQARTDS